MVNIDLVSTQFADRVKSRKSPTVSSAPSVHIVAAENDFPFARINFLRVGSAHTECEPAHDEANIDLMLRISTHIMSRYEPGRLPAKLSVDYKSKSERSAKHILSGVIVSMVLFPFTQELNHGLSERFNQSRALATDSR
jgi:hypothetical protein